MLPTGVATRKSLLIVVLALAGAGLLFALERTAEAATFTVTTTTDAVDAAPGDGTCATAAGDCSLRAAMQEANAAAGADLITVPAGVYRLTIVGTLEDEGLTGDIDITDDVVIEGAGAEGTRLDAARIDRYFHTPSVNVAVSVTLRSLTIENGMAITGGGIRVGNGSLTIEDAALINNIANDADEGNGGAVSIARGEALRVSGSVIRGNTADTGGGIVSGVETTITDTTIADNRADDGGGVQVADAPLMAERITVSGNSATGAGGGLQTFRSEMHVSNSTISGNSASSVRGAGVSLGSGMSTLRHVTVVGNTGGFGVGGSFGAATLENVVVANNPGGDCQRNLPVTAVGGNLDSDGTCGVALTGAPQIGPLSDNGGPTLTHALLPGSPAIDAAGGCPPPATDQRGEPRPQGARCDLGAFEAEPGQAPVDGPTRAIQLLSGFALLGWTGPDTPVAEAIAPIADVVLGVWTWEIPSQSFRFFSPTAPAFLNSLQTLQFGDGFWILVSRAVTWELPVQQ